MKNILVINDDPPIAIFVREGLAKFGHDVETCLSGKEALVRLQRFAYQLILTDLCMSELSGLEVLRFVRARMPQVPVVLLTGYGSVESAVEAMKLGAFDYLVRPVSLRRLNAVVEQALCRLPGGWKPVILTADAEMIKLLDLARRTAMSEANVLIEGESGTGKELLARYIHQESRCRDKPFIAVNCAALPENLLESELFGFEKGSFTGAVQPKPGKFELAHEGTLLLDEIGEMAPSLQAKLLRVIQEKEVDRIGATRARSVQVRIIATTNRNLKDLVKQGCFRRDLYYRLNVVRLRIPPLRERQDDLPLLVSAFVQKYGKGKRIQLDPKSVEILRQYYWPGNVRELENTVQRAFALRQQDGPDNLFLLPDREEEPDAGLLLPVGYSLQEIEKIYILQTLKETRGNRTRASKLLKIAVRTLHYKLKKYRLTSLSIFW